MSALITLDGGVATMGKRPVDDSISNMELAKRLGVAEELIQLREEVKTLRAKNVDLNLNLERHLSCINNLSLQEGDLLLLPEDIEESAVQMIANHVRDTLGINNIVFVMGDLERLSDEEKAHILKDQIESRISTMRTEMIGVRQENQHLHDYNKELKAAGDQLGKDLDVAKEDNRKMAINLTSANRKTADALNSKTELEKQLKELKKLDPERLKKQVAELKKSNKEKQEGVEGLRKQNHKLVKDNKAKANTITGLNQALDKACAEMNKQQKLDPLETVNCGNLGKWEIYGTGETYRYNVLDKKNDVSMTLQVNDTTVDIPEVRTPPKSLLKAVVARAARNAATEAKIENDQKPLGQGVV